MLAKRFTAAVAEYSWPRRDRWHRLPWRSSSSQSNRLSLPLPHRPATRAGRLLQQSEWTGSNDSDPL